MLSYFDLRKGVQFILEGQPYEVLEFKQMGKAQDVVVAQTKIKNLLNGKTLYRSFHKGDSFLEAEVQKFQAKFLYNHRGKFVFEEQGKRPSTRTEFGAGQPRTELRSGSGRFELNEEQVGEGARFLKPNEMVDGITFEGNFVNISLPVKVQLRVKEAPPGFKGNTAQGGTKSVTLETGATLDVPLFIETDDVVEINTEIGEYSKRVEKGE